MESYDYLENLLNQSSTRITSKTTKSRDDYHKEVTELTKTLPTLSVSKDEATVNEELLKLKAAANPVEKLEEWAAEEIQKLKEDRQRLIGHIQDIHVTHEKEKVNDKRLPLHQHLRTIQALSNDPVPKFTDVETTDKLLYHLNEACDPWFTDRGVNDIETKLLLLKTSFNDKPDLLQTFRRVTEMEEFQSLVKQNDIKKVYIAIANTLAPQRGTKECYERSPETTLVNYLEKRSRILSYHGKNDEEVAKEMIDEIFQFPEKLNVDKTVINDFRDEYFIKVQMCQKIDLKQLLTFATRLETKYDIKYVPSSVTKNNNLNALMAKSNVTPNENISNEAQNNDSNSFVLDAIMKRFDAMDQQIKKQNEQQNHRNDNYRNNNRNNNYKGRNYNPNYNSNNYNRGRNQQNDNYRGNYQNDNRNNHQNENRNNYRNDNRRNDNNQRNYNNRNDNYQRNNDNRNNGHRNYNNQQNNRNQGYNNQNRANDFPLFCTHCNYTGHLEKDCRRKNKFNTFQLDTTKIVPKGYNAIGDLRLEILLNFLTGKFPFHSTRSLFDTGANVNGIELSLLKEQGLIDEINYNHIESGTVADGNTLTSIGLISLTCLLDGKKEERIDFLVFDKLNTPVILGTPFMEQTKIYGKIKCAWDDFVNGTVQISKN